MNCLDAFETMLSVARGTEGRVGESKLAPLVILTHCEYDVTDYLWTPTEDRRRWGAITAEASVGVPPTTPGRHGF